jgi:hypothetical protein
MVDDGLRDWAGQSETPAAIVERGEFGTEPAAWCDLYEKRAAIRQYDGHYSRAEAEALAWGEMQNRWHAEHGERVSRDFCAGCRRPIGTAAALDLIDGSRVHLDVRVPVERDHGFRWKMITQSPEHALDGGNDCLIRHGKRWRAAATRALTAFGLCPPVGVDQ